MEISQIKITNAKTHNLKNISLNIPRNKFVVITGPSGSGKSSLAFDTIYAESQRRYIESLSAYARQFLDQFQPPDVESITGLSPSIAIDQKTVNRNPRSTVGTTSEIYDYLRVLFARVGTPHCPDCNRVVEKQTPALIIKSILQLKQNEKIQLLAPIIINKKGEHLELLSKYESMGLNKIRIDETIYDFSSLPKLDKHKVHNIDLVIDRLILKNGIEKRVSDSVSYALKLSNGLLRVLCESSELFFSEHSYCPTCEKSFPELDPKAFSFNSPQGACQTCNGLGEIRNFSTKTLVFDPSLSILDGAIPVLYKRNSFLLSMVKNVAEQENINLNQSFNSLPLKFKNVLFDGSDKIYNFSFKSENSRFEFKKSFPGIISWLNKKLEETNSEKSRLELEKFLEVQKCKSCKGQRLNAFSLATKIFDKNIYDITELSIGDCINFFNSIHFKNIEKDAVFNKLFKEIISRLTFLKNVGGDYLSLSRTSSSLSGGEAQRIRLATQIGSYLSGILYVLDEPSIGLHQRDNIKLINTLKELRDLGNTVLVVEHDKETILNADYVVDIGPGAGNHGGEVIATGTPKEIINNPNSITGHYLTTKKSSGLDLKNNSLSTSFIIATGCKKNNIKDLTLKIPLNRFVCITGISGSGKSTLVHEILIPAIKARLKKII